MRDVFGSWLAGATLCLWLSGCANPPPPADTTSQAAPAAQYRTAQQVSARAPAAPIVRRFVGIPMPANNLLDLDRTVVVGDGNDWLGRVFFSTPMSVEQAIEFYRQDMPRYGWTELAVTQSDTSVLAYRMGNRMATIELTPRPATVRTPTARTQVEFWVNPLQPSPRQEAAQPADSFPPSAPIAAPAARPAGPPAGAIDGVSASFPASRAVQQAPLPPP